MSRVTPPAEVEEAEVDGAKEAGGATVPECLNRNYASLCLTILAFIAPMTWKGSEEGKGTSKWRKSLMIAEEKVSLTQVAISL